MKDKQAKYPQLRFKGFTDPWEQRNLGEVVDVKSGRDYKHLSEGDIPVYGTGGYMLSVDEALSQNDDAIGIGRKGTIDNPYLLRAPFWTVDTLFYAIPRVGFDLNFTFDIFQKVNWRKLDESTGVPSLSKATINSVSAAVPSEDEQIKIGGLFEKIDNLIAANQRKLNLLKEQKKGYLQKMFPKNGAKVPELRFAGFADAWEQRNIKEISKVFIGLVTSMTENYRDNGTLLIRNSDIKSGHFEFSKDPIYLDEVFAEKNASRRLKIGDVITVHTGDIGTSAVVGKREEGSIGFATINTRPDKSVLDSDYLSTYFNTTVHKHWAIKMSTGDGRSNYNLYDFNRLIVPLPNIEEQQKIGSFFKQLDNLITLHQRKLEKLQELKKGYLQKMFV